ncbi:MAG: H-NS histone family protein [Burkholderiales bacterium]|jgi:DNA-binding protein H-NS|uniref:H-NS histone family protein n=1 Tax=Limnobacter sp. TaxID=2003368 RepID=UPI0039607A87|nr:H-NS histone family protein [Burkholderiales bacterium]
MKKLNLSALSASELQQLKSDIEKELNDRSSKLQAIEEVKKLAASKGLKLEELFAELGGSKAGKGKRELGPAPVRFRHPQDSSLTWSGRGKRPNWMKEAMDKGLTEDQMRV